MPANKSAPARLRLRVNNHGKATAEFIVRKQSRALLCCRKQSFRQVTQPNIDPRRPWSGSRANDQDMVIDPLASASRREEIFIPPPTSTNTNTPARCFVKE
jgi:hypothetical protein